MKVVVNKYLNARIGKPAVSAACETYKIPGDVIDVDDIITGSEIDGNSVWYHSKDDGCYYWSGGVEYVNEEIKTIDSINKGRELIMNEAIQYHWETWKRTVNGFTGVAVADKTKNNVVIPQSTLVFHVSNKVLLNSNDLGAVPAKVVYHGIAIDTDVIQASFANFNTAVPGSSISRIREINEWGTVALKVYRRNDPGSYYLLTNYHVAAFDLLQRGQLIYRYPPSINNRQVIVPSQRSNPSNASFIGALSEGRLSPYYDVALVLLNDGNLASNNNGNIFIKDYIDVYDDSMQYLNKPVILYGAASQTMNSTIRSIHSNQVFFYSGGFSIDLMGLIQIDKCTTGGDSGCPVVMNQKIIGINVGADDQYTYAIPVKRILDFYNLKISQS